jgi:hypothetical protein
VICKSWNPLLLGSHVLPVGLQTTTDKMIYSCATAVEAEADRKILIVRYVGCDVPHFAVFLY